MHQLIYKIKKVSIKTLSIIFIIIIVVIIIITGFLFYRYKQVSQQNNILAMQLQNLQKELAASQSSSVNHRSPLELETYTNKKLGFSIKYPKKLSLTAKEVDTKAEYREYKRKCDISGGCGGGRMPDFLINFHNVNDLILFKIYVYQLPTMHNGVGDIERDNFTYGISINSTELDKLQPNEKLYIKNIADTLKFIIPEKPLSCLWSPELGPGFDIKKDAKSIKENKEKLSLLSGYYFNNTLNNCEEISFYTWSHQVDTDAPPFNNKQSCISACITNFK